MMNRTADRKPTSIYLVIEGQIEPYCVERALPDMSWDATVKDLAEMQFENLSQIIEVGTGRDVTQIMMREAMDYRDSHRIEATHKFGVLVELVLGTRAARPFLRAA